MEIPSNNINQPVTFYTKNTGNTINMAIDDNQFYQSNIFSPELNEQIINNKKVTKPIRKKRKNKRLNTLDSDYLPDTIDEETINQEERNFFIKSSLNIKKRIEYIMENLPLINYFYMRNKGKKIRQTVEILNDINENVDELLNSKVPYGEEKEIYSSVAKNLGKAINLIGKTNKNI